MASEMTFFASKAGSPSNYTIVIFYWSLCVRESRMERHIPSSDKENQDCC